MLISATGRKQNLYNICIGGNSFDAVNKFRYQGGNEGCINVTVHSLKLLGVGSIIY